MIKLLTSTILFVAWSVQISNAQQEPNPDQLAFFENKLPSILAEHCFSCHPTT